MPRAAKPSDPLAEALDKNLRDWSAALEKAKQENPKSVATWEKKLVQLRAQMADIIDAAKYDYQDLQLKDAAGNIVYRRPPFEELVRWRLWDRTGGGLMAELGSHQLDAAGIFIHAMHKAVDPKAEKPHPLNVAAAADRPLFPADRDVEDHVYCIVEYPAPGYDPKDPIASRKKIGVQYASINGNGFGGYGETVFGTAGTLLLETEKEAMLFKTDDTSGKTRVVLATSGEKKGAPILQLDEKGDPESAAIGTLGALPAERGYTEELEHWAWCIRNPAPENQPRCRPKVALADAVIALVTNMAARKGERKVFQEDWFNIDSDETPENIKPDPTRYK
jgi:predicted dehydrogenase